MGLFPILLRWFWNILIRTCVVAILGRIVLRFYRADIGSVLDLFGWLTPWPIIVSLMPWTSIAQGTSFNPVGIFRHSHLLLRTAGFSHFAMLLSQYRLWNDTRCCDLQLVREAGNDMALSSHKRVPAILCNLGRIGLVVVGTH